MTTGSSGALMPPPEPPMLAAVDAIGLLLGAALAALAERFPARTEVIETCAGFLVIGALALAGAALPAML